MNFLPTLWLLALAIASLASCGMVKKPAKPATENPVESQAPKLVGRIASIPPDKRFVLIQSYGRWIIETGTILTTRGADGRSANLLTTGETLGQFAAADLQSGLVEVGDAVYSRHIPKPETQAEPAEATPEPVESEPLPDFENVQKFN